MEWFSLREIEFLPEHERVLRETVIDESGPGTVLHDFKALLAFVGARTLAATPGHQLPRGALPEINERLAQPLKLGLRHPLLKSYPHITGLYLLARASGLISVAGTTKEPRLTVNDALHRVWSSLNDTERYFTLVEAWLLRGHTELIGEEGRRWYGMPETFGHCSRLMRRIPGSGMEVGGDRETERGLRKHPGWHNLGLMELFGLVTIQHGLPEAGRGWRIQRIRRTPLGDALMALLHTRFFDDTDRVRRFRDEEQVPFGLLRPVLRPYFPAWRHTLCIPGREPQVESRAHPQEGSAGSGGDQQWLEVLVESGAVPEARAADMHAEAGELSAIIRATDDESEDASITTRQGGDVKDDASRMTRR